MVSRTIDWMKSFALNAEGVTAIEYAIIGAVIAVVIIVAVGLVAVELNSSFLALANQMHGS